jgi:hypothetical protein
MTARHLLSALAAVVALAAARPAAAQRATSQALPVASTSAASYETAHAAARVVAQYAVSGAHGAPGAPAQITVSDVGGELAARVRLVGESASRPMTVTVMDTDVVLQAETPRGLLTFVLRGQNDDAAMLGGRWSLGTAAGTLRARTRS